MRCLIITRQTLVHSLLALLLEQLCGVEVLGPCSDFDQAEPALATLLPDLLLVDGSDGQHQQIQLRLQRWAGAQLPRVILMTMAGDDRMVSAPHALQWVGVDAPDFLARLVEAVGQSGDPGQAAEPIPALPDPRLLRRLAPRERAVLHGLAAGLGNKEVAQDLGLSLQTIETYRRSLCSKLGVSGARLLRLAVLYGLIQAKEPPALPQLLSLRQPSTSAQPG